MKRARDIICNWLEASPSEYGFCWLFDILLHAANVVSLELWFFAISRRVDVIGFTGTGIAFNCRWFFYTISFLDVGSRSYFGETLRSQ